MDNDVAKVSDLYFNEAPSYESSNLYNWTCLEDPF